MPAQPDARITASRLRVELKVTLSNHNTSTGLLPVIGYVHVVLSYLTGVSRSFTNHLHK
jgi:hypothetical protein